jgi:hypothetical protein
MPPELVFDELVLGYICLGVLLVVRTRSDCYTYT